MSILPVSRISSTDDVAPLTIASLILSSATKFNLKYHWVYSLGLQTNNSSMPVEGTLVIEGLSIMVLLVVVGASLVGGGSTATYSRDSKD